MQVDISLDDFLAKVVERNTNPDGTLIEPSLMRRFDNPICQACHAQYKQKYPGKQFSIKCSGIYDERDYLEKQQELQEMFPEDEPIPIEVAEGNDIREVFDVAYWGNKHVKLKDDEGHYQPFVARDYQIEALSCTAAQKVDRWARGLGKSSTGLIEELHKVITTPNLDLLVICPADTQSNSWYEGFINYINESASLKGVIADSKQNPYRQIKFVNGSIIRIVTAGSASGRKATSIRGLSPRRIRIDEQDYLVEEDWGAISPLLTRYANSEFHGSSTPTGDRSKYWVMCTQDTRYKEFYYPIMRHPKWDAEMELICRTEARTEDRYRFEYLAEFGDPTQGVFKNMYIDAAKVSYQDPNRPTVRGYNMCTFDETKEYFMGVDWNGQGTGTRIRVVEYDPLSTNVRVVGAYSVAHEGFTSFDSIDAIDKYNKQWHCAKICIDAGFGGAQYDMLRMKGAQSKDSDTRKLKDVIKIDFGAKLRFNSIVPARDDARMTRYKDDEEFDRRTKPYLVEGAVMMFEQHRIQFSDEDKILESQLRSYRVGSYAKSGQADTYKVDANVGDHDLDAFMLSLLAVEMNHGLYSNPAAHRPMAQVSFSEAFGIASPSTSSNALLDKKAQSGVPSRTPNNKANKNASIADDLRMMYLMRNNIPTAPLRQPQGPGTRTSNLGKGTGRTSYWSSRTPPRRTR